MKALFTLSLLASLSLSVVACGDGGRAAAEAGLSSAQTAFDAAKTAAGPYAPDAVQDIDNSLAAARETFAKGNYLQALAEAQLLPKKISALGAAAAAKKSELTKEWSDVSTALPTALEGIQRQIEVLSKSRRMPAGMTKETFDGARAGAEAMTQTWAEATESAKTGNLLDAVTKADVVKAKAVEVLTALGMQVPDALK